MRKSPKSKGSGLIFDHVSLSKGGSTLAMDVPAGATLAIMGGAASGKSSLLGAIAGSEGVAQGAIVRPSETYSIASPEWSRRETPLSTSKEILGKDAAQKAAETLTALGLWDVRQKPYLSLSPSQQSAALFIPPLLTEPGLVCSDHDLDLLDWVTLQNLWSALAEQRKRGMILAFATHRPDIAEWSDFILVVKGEQVVFSGTPEALKRTATETIVDVATENRAGVRAIVEPFEISIQETSEGLRMKAKEGQALAAKLLLEGYGDVKFVIQRPPTLGEALTRLIG